MSLTKLVIILEKKVYTNLNTKYLYILAVCYFSNDYF